MKKLRAFLIFAILLLHIQIVLALQKYEKPPEEIMKVLNAPLPPSPYLSPKHDMLVLAQTLRYPPISDLAEPLLALAGIRVNPNTNAERSYISYATGFTLKRLSDGHEFVMLPYESHGYSARESTEHVLYEMISWFDKHVKNAKPNSNR